MTSGKVCVRFAPSPTGYLHIGGVRTALFNFLYSKHHGGSFILRIEDTDQDRSTEESIQAILDGMQWLGLTWDAGPYRQTERLPLYQTAVDRLLSEGKAYRCYCLPEELEERRKQAMASGKVPKYDGRCRVIDDAVKKTNKPDIPHWYLERSLTKEKSAIRFKSPQTGETVVEDLVKGKVVFENSQLDDLIIMRSDGWPTYNFCVVVDDVDMVITHVIRGDDHLNNTPRQVQLYLALGYVIPRFAHLPMILGSDKTRLSKRHGATSVSVYREMGYLPEALVNYLVRLGWSYKDQEIFTLAELIEKFSLEAVGTSASVFNPDKLLWLNSQWIAHMEINEVIRRLRPYLEKEGLIGADSVIDEVWMSKVIVALSDGCRTLVEMASASGYFFKEEIEIDPEARKKVLTPESIPVLQRVLVGLQGIPDLSQEEVERLFKEIMEEAGFKMGQVAQPVRVALTGRTVSPGIYDVIEILGRGKTIRRLERAIRLTQSEGQ
ncbi:MAG: glutamate--tRNA ligase [Nitrospirae bacterium]|nr:glutamate--tRNA ligase [Nitrospirota bacterium]